MDEPIIELELEVEETPQPLKPQEKIIDGMASEHEEYLQEDFQDIIVRDIFEEIVDYVRTYALPLCEVLTMEDVEDIINQIYF
jgi:hypothetical protein